ncbi:antiviral reverse transcriptase Drt5 [Trichormus sp. NMC-1]|uniref:antiviral reverse transcriptase Drt5 n=1 Tax=Trichormus sp. NMC-1 TaxID=1853259 RepID=UPI0015A50785|nr:antiviral reverse transcriptase Drt5 [Trichormus sp. NMC-1]
MVSNDNAGLVNFIVDDLKRTLFPLNLTAFMAQYAHKELQEYIDNIYARTGNFHSQTTVYADKPNRTLRRTLKLDPIAEWYIYSIIYKYKDKFQEINTERVSVYGYKFKSVSPVPGRDSYRNFKNEFYSCREKFKYSMELDIANYFNTIYHHDLQHWFARLADDDQDAKVFGQFLREINTGRSIDCLPQGIYPAKMIGNSYLQYIDYNGSLRSKRYLRFMDDFILFDNDESVLYEDLYKLQTLLGNKSLSINEGKLKLPSKADNANYKDIDEIKISLLNVREQLLQDYDGIQDEDEMDSVILNKEQKDFLLGILKNDNIDEEDAELVLVLMRDSWNDGFDKISNIAFDYPNLAKSSYKFFESVEDRETVAKTILQRVLKGEHLTEYQLFWMAKMCEDFLLETASVGELLYALYEHRSATTISQAKILEIQDTRYGLPEMRETILRDGSSTWASWCAAFGSKSEVKARINHHLKYFQNPSIMNNIVGKVISNL